MPTSRLLRGGLTGVDRSRSGRAAKRIGQAAAYGFF
jgi:hypothetical protein